MSRETQFIETDERTEAFDKLLPKRSVNLGAKSKRITASWGLRTHVVGEEPSNPFHRAIFRAFASAFQTAWFAGLLPKSQQRYLTEARQFADWINETTSLITEDNCYDLLKNYEAKRLNVDGIKHSPLRSIVPAIKKGMDTTDLSDQEYGYLRKLTRLTKLSKPPEANPYTLSDWFDLPWLRSLLGESQYLSLESPSRLLNSFRVTIATTLCYLLEIRDQWKSRTRVATEANTNKNWFWVWNTKLIKQLGNFNVFGEATDEFTELLLLDMVRDKELPNLRVLISERGCDGLRQQPLFPRRFSPWKKPVVFHPDNLFAYSPIEELLMAWLVACETVQPMDIPKLKTSDYACEYNSSGRLIAMQCSYYKGRAGAIREPLMLIASDCWTIAQHTYLKGLSPSAPLFRSNVGRQMTFPNLQSESYSQPSPFGTLIRLWKTPHLQTRIRTAMRRSGTLPIFLDAALALTNGSQSYNGFLKKHPGSSPYDYQVMMPRPLPLNVFGLMYIKTTAVHAGSDQYRDGDLINHHSHTSATEKQHYLTDANKDFVNRAGRITRLVLNDFQTTVYQPSVRALSQAVNDLELRSRVMDVTGSTDALVHPLNVPNMSSDSSGQILVPDTVGQALIFMHYIAQAEERYQQLLQVRPDWVERTFLPHLEWMSRTLARMHSSNEARKQYTSLSAHLPPVFDHLLETQE